MYKLLLTGSGGAIGALARYGVGFFFPSSASFFPYSTLFINGIGSFVLACLTYSVLKEGKNEGIKLFFGTGLCGGFTTMSTFAFEVTNLADTHPALGLAYLVSTLVIGLVMAWLGFLAGFTMMGR